MSKKETLYPVLLAVPESARKLPPADRVKYLSRHARKALAASARKSNVELGDLHALPQRALFSEELGAMFQLRRADLPHVLSRFDDAGFRRGAHTRQRS